MRNTKSYARYSSGYQSKRPERTETEGFPGGPVVKNPPANAEDTGLIPGLGSFHMLQGNLAREPELLSPSARAHMPHY